MTARSTRWSAAAVALLALASSAIGIVNQFAYDDEYVVAKNLAVHDLHHWWRAFLSPYWPRGLGGDGYRPLTILAFKIEYVLGGGGPMAFHAVNIALYVAVSVCVFVLAKRLLPGWAALLAAACFAVHPVHVEAVANVVGQSELLVAIALLPATILFLRDRATGPLRPRTAAVIAALYAVACFSKEHGVVLPAILLAAEVTIIEDARSWRERLRHDRWFYLVLILIATAMVGLRSHVLSDHSLAGFEPYTPFSSLATSSRDRVLTAVSVVPEWLRLFYWPVRLSPEYGPAEIRIAQGFAIEQVPGFAILVGVLALAWIVRRRQPVVTFGIAFGCAALLPSSNFILPAGIVLAERTLLLPSVGAMLVLGALAVTVSQVLRERSPSPRLVARLCGAACAAVIAAATVHSIRRTTVWHDNGRLFHRAVIDAPRSYRAHYLLAAWNLEQKRFDEGEAEYRKALALFPYDPFVALGLAEHFRRTSRCGPAIPLYQLAHGIKPSFSLGYTGLAECLIVRGQYAEAKPVALHALSIGADSAAVHRLLFLADSMTAANLRPAARPARAVRSGIVRDTVQKARQNAPAPAAGDSPKRYRETG